MKGLEKETKEERNGPLKDPYIFFPTCQVRVVFSFLPFFLSSAAPDLNSKRQIAVGSTGPQDGSGHHRTLTASARCQWALPDLNSNSQIAVGTTGPEHTTTNTQHTTTNTNHKHTIHSPLPQTHNHKRNHKHTITTSKAQLQAHNAQHNRQQKRNTA